MKNPYSLFLLWITYSFLGWLIESVFISVHKRKFINSGFLHGPICPIYGFGAILVIFFFSSYKNNLILIFILGMSITSLIEFITSYAMEKLLHKRWWDYSRMPFSLQGRICLLYSCFFGIMSVSVMYIIHPLITEIFIKISNNTQKFLSIYIFILLLFDLYYSYKRNNNQNKKPIF